MSLFLIEDGYRFGGRTHILQQVYLAKVLPHRRDLSERAKLRPSASREDLMSSAVHFVTLHDEYCSF